METYSYRFQANNSCIYCFQLNKYSFDIVHPSTEIRPAITASGCEEVAKPSFKRFNVYKNFNINYKPVVVQIRYAFMCFISSSGL
jgi:hypothetical protein